MSEKLNVLVLVPHYKYFIKDSVEATNRYVRRIDVLIHRNRLAEVSKYLPFKGYMAHVRKFTADQLADLSGLPENVGVHLLPMLYLVPDGSNASLGEEIFRHADRFIHKKGIRIDAIHAHFAWPTGYAGARLKEKYHVPLIVTAHGYDVYSLPFVNARWRSRISYVLNSADKIITVSQSNISSIQKLGISTPISLIPNGFRKDLFYPRDASQCKGALGLPKDRKIILTVGCLEHEKGQMHLIAAIRELVKVRKDILCILVGSGQLLTTFERQVHSAGLDGHFMFTGGKPHTEIPAWINACDVFVLPSLVEGNPTVMFECLGCGKPFIGTAVGGIPEIIVSDDYGFLCNPGDPGDLVKKILVALDKSWDRGKILRYAERFTWDRIATEISDIYRSAVSEKARPGGVQGHENILRTT